MSSLNTADATSASESTPKKRILLVEDDEGLRDVAALTLRSNGYEVQEAADGLIALSHIDPFKPDLIVSDLDMPEMDGIQMGQELRGCGVTTPILVTSSKVDHPAYAPKIAKITPHSMLKPYLPRIFLAKVAEILQHAA